MHITLFTNFSKRINSTARPTSGGITVEAVLKQSTSIENPTFLIDGVNLNFNYVTAFSHYYYVSDIIVGNNNIIEVSCVQDVLSTYREYIRNTSAYVEYAASSYNKWIPDSRLSMSTDVSTSTRSTLAVSWDVGVIILQTAANDPSGTSQVGFSNVYRLSGTSAAALSDYLYNANDSIITEIEKSFANIYDSILSAYWVPIGLPFGQNTTIRIGNQGTTAVAAGLKENALAEPQHFSLEIPWVHNDWRDFNPYSVMQLYLPMYGTVIIDQSKLKGQSRLSVDMALDMIGGTIVYTCSAGQFFEEFKVDCKVPLAVGQTTTNKVGGLMQLASGALSYGSSAAVAGAGHPASTSGALGGIVQVTQGLMTYFSQSSGAKGTLGGFGDFSAVLKSANNSPMRSIRLTLYSHAFGVSSPGNINAINGRPLFEVKKLGDLSGFIKCSGASVNMPGLSSDRDTVNSYLNAGIYLE